jgi:hypothetical protein
VAILSLSKLVNKKTQKNKKQMAKHTRSSSQEALLEGLKGQTNQLQEDLGRLAEEMRENHRKL